MSRLAKKLRALVRRRQLDRDLADELAFHLAMKAEEAGSEQAQRNFGNATRLKEACRDLWSFSKLESYVQDLRYAIRMLVKTPGFTLVAVVALALGISVTVTPYRNVIGA